MGNGDLGTAGKPQAPRRRWIVAAAAGVAVLGLVAAIFMRAFPNAIEAAKRSKTKAMMRSMDVGAQAFYTEYFAYPTGENAVMYRVLRGENRVQNPRGIVFVSFRNGEVNDKGEVLDAWGTPLNVRQIDDPFSPDYGRPIFRSAGQDRFFLTEDDLILKSSKP